MSRSPEPILSLTMDQPASGVWPSAAGSTWFSSDDLALSLNRSTTGTYEPGDGAFVLEPLTLPVHVAGEIALGSTGTPLPVDIDTHHVSAVSGTLQSDGSLTVSGSFELSPGMIVTFEPPAPK